MTRCVPASLRKFLRWWNFWMEQVVSNNYCVFWPQTRNTLPLVCQQIWSIHCSSSLLSFRFYPSALIFSKKLFQLPFPSCTDTFGFISFTSMDISILHTDWESPLLTNSSTTNPFSLAILLKTFLIACFYSKIWSYPSSHGIVNRINIKFPLLFQNTNYAWFQEHRFCYTLP